MGASSPLSFWIRTGAPRQVPRHVARHGHVTLRPRYFTDYRGPDNVFVQIASTLVYNADHRDEVQRSLEF